MPISVADPITPAIERTKKVLFQPFEFSKWIHLGFCAFLAYLGEGGANVPSFQGNWGGGGQGGPNFDEIHTKIMDNLTLIVVIAVAAVLFLFVLGVVFTWLGSRGKFMFIDGIVHNRGDVVQPWREFRREGNSLFGFRILFGLGSFAVFLLVIAIALALAWGDIQAKAFGAGALAGLLLGLCLVLVVALVQGVVILFLVDFVVPIMYLRRLRVLEAWRVFRHELLAGRAGTFVLYFLFKILISMVVGFMAATLVLCTCCIAVIPYVGSVILLPVLVFNQSYPLYFIEQFGPEWRFFRHAAVIDEDEEETAGEQRPEDEAPPPDDRIAPA